MRPTTSPCPTVRSTSSTATRPPKRTDTPRTRSAGTSAGSCTRSASSTTRAGIGAPAIFVTSAGGQALGEHLEDEVAEVGNDLHESAGEVEEQDQEAGAAGEQARLSRVVEERGQPDHPQRAEDAPLIDDSPPITAIAMTRSDSSGGNASGRTARAARRAARRPDRRARRRCRTRVSFIRAGEIAERGRGPLVVAHRDQRSADTAAADARARRRRRRAHRGRRSSRCPGCATSPGRSMRHDRLRRRAGTAARTATTASSPRTRAS